MTIPADRTAPTISTQSPEQVRSRPALNAYQLVKHIRARLPGIKSTVRLLTKNGELADYDDECANDLYYAVKYLERASELLDPAPSQSTEERTTGTGVQHD